MPIRLADRLTSLELVRAMCVVSFAYLIFRCLLDVLKSSTSGSQRADIECRLYLCHMTEPNFI